MTIKCLTMIVSMRFEFTVLKGFYELVPCLHKVPRMLADRERVHRIALI